MSYNPPASAYQELLQTAHEIEEQRERKWAESKKKMGRVETSIVGAEEGVALGMKVDLVQSDDDKDGEADENYTVIDVKKLPDRKTKQQRSKAAKLLAEVRCFDFYILLNFANAKYV
jgi:nucleolar protein 53